MHAFAHNGRLVAINTSDSAFHLVTGYAFAIGATVELQGLVSNPAANGRRVVVVQTPPDVAARGRISVNLDGVVRAVKRENVRAVPGSDPSAGVFGPPQWRRFDLDMAPGITRGVAASILFG